MSWADIRSEVRDGRDVIVKSTSYDARLEAEGLEALGAAGAPVPEVLEVTEHRLIMAEVSGSPDWESLAVAVSDVHRHTADTFGWRGDNVIGDRPQRNSPADDWPTFYIERRLRPWLGSLPSELRRRLDHAMSGVLVDLLDHDAVPSLIHGDLWSGNVVDGSWLIDPAVSHSDREVDLAFARLFGGIPERFFDAYADAWPLDIGWEQRLPALQLYHALVHVEIFGSAYVPMVDRLLRALGA